MSTREFISPERQRRAYLKLVWQNGRHDGFYAGEKLREQAYLKDEEALTRYRMAFRIGKLQRETVSNEG